VVQDKLAEHEVESGVWKIGLLQRRGYGRQAVVLVGQSLGSALHDIDHSGAQIERRDVSAVSEEVQGQVALPAPGIQDAKATYLARKPEQRAVERIGLAFMHECVDIEIPSQGVVELALSRPHALGDGFRQRHGLAVCHGTQPACILAGVNKDERLNLGSGRAYDAAWTNLDVTPDTGPDVVHDLNVRPWPFDDDRFAEVKAIDVIEHLDDAFAALVELHRVCRSGATLKIVVPHFSSANAYTDPTHRRALGYFSLDVVTGDHAHDYYTRVRYRMRRREIVFKQRPINKFVRRYAARNPAKYEERWAWILPAWFVVFELEVLKDPN
jgi:predicted SAM-dependent methyltransferase